MAIACAYCGGVHERPADVRQCWVDGGRPDLDPSAHDPRADDLEPDDLEPDAPEPDAPEPDAPETDHPEPDRSPADDPAARSPAADGGARRAGPVDVAPRRLAPARPGPDALGRHALIGAGEPAPEAWTGCPRLRIDERTLGEPSTALAELRTAAHERRRMVIELALDFDAPPMSTTRAEPYSLGADFVFELETLHHHVWSNSIDHRDPDAPTWTALDLAVHRGSVPTAPGMPGDIVGPDGAPLWIDGGPLARHDPIDGVPVIHVAAIEHGGVEAPLTDTCRAELASDQLAAVTHAGGAARVVAPAGSGKTRVLTERARHLAAAWRLPVGAVTLVAFNKRAQEEMQGRLSDVGRLQIRTLNSLALAIVNGTPPFAPQPRRWNTIDEPEVRRILGGLVSFPRRRNSDPVAPWIEALGLVRLGLVDPAEVEARYDGDVEGLAGVWPRYRERLERAGAVDFDDQVYRALRVLLDDPVARRAAQRACRTMLVDEFQDLTPAHVLLIRLLSSPGGAVFGVGDDDQTIYGYNGADPGWLIDFGEWFPGAGDHPLEVNYRCPAGIVDGVDRLLRHNRRRVPKTIRASSSDPAGWRVDGSVDAVSATRSAVEAAIASGARPNEIAVLTRVNALCAPAQVALATAGVPISGGVGLEFLERTSVRAVLAWLRLALTAASDRARFAPDDVREALRRPSRSFHPRITDWIAEQGTVVDLFRLAGRLNNDRDADRVNEFAGDVQTLQRLVDGRATTSDVVLALIDEIGLAGSVATLDATRRGMNRGAQGDDLTAMTHLAALHDDPATFEAELRRRLATRRDPGGVTLATVHRVKGQEWPHVVVHMADAEQYPHRLADDVEEERRLFHVALTRASVAATIVTGAHPSPFVEELTTEPDPARTVSSHAPDVEPPRSASRRRADPSGELDDDATARFEALRSLRNELRDGKPAYVVFDNKTLAAIADRAPTTKADLAKISGVGPAKLERYGDAVIGLISELLR